MSHALCPFSHFWPLFLNVKTPPKSGQSQGCPLRIPRSRPPEGCALEKEMQTLKGERVELES